MIIFNKSKNTYLSSFCVEAKNLKTKTLGLIFSKKPKALFLQTRFGIHTFGMSYPIDIAVLNKENKVVKLKHNLQPNRLFFYQVRFNKVLEMPAKTLKKAGTELQDTIVLTA